MKTTLITMIFFILSGKLLSQNIESVYTSDIDNFWIAYDSIKRTNDFTERLKIINGVYISKGTIGLKAFMDARDYNDTLWVTLIDKYPKFWNSIRPNTLAIKDKAYAINAAVLKFKKLYPGLKPSSMYFTIGGLRSGGTIKDKMVLIGCEIATGDVTTNTSEFQNDWLKNVFKVQSKENIISLNIHEYVHTQQNGVDQQQVLAQSIKEGSCDFITELIIETPLQKKYLEYGKQNAKKIKALFKKEMFANDLSNWLYNGGQKGESADLGYYIGYLICKNYYKHSKDKSKAIKEIIELNYNSAADVEKFLKDSKFFTEKIDKEKIISQYNESLPEIINIVPMDNYISASTKELKINFSKPMQTGFYSINLSGKGKDFFPITGVKGYENDDKTLILNIELKPNKEYEFVIVNRDFRSKDGFKLKQENYEVHFMAK